MVSHELVVKHHARNGRTDLHRELYLRYMQCCYPEN